MPQCIFSRFVLQLLISIRPCFLVSFNQAVYNHTLKIKLIKKRNFFINNLFPSISTLFAWLIFNFSIKFLPARETQEGKKPLLLSFLIQLAFFFRRMCHNILNFFRAVHSSHSSVAKTILHWNVLSKQITIRWQSINLTCSLAQIQSDRRLSVSFTPENHFRSPQFSRKKNLFMCCKTKNERARARARAKKH